jgi:hypothetical protein
MRKVLLSSLVLSIVTFSMPIVPIAQQIGRPVSYSAAGPLRGSSFLHDLSEPTAGENSDLYSTEAKKIAAVLAKETKKSPIVIDQTGNDRELIMSAAAAKISSVAPGRRVLSVDWTTLFETSKSEKDVETACFRNPASGRSVEGQRHPLH